MENGSFTVKGQLLDVIGKEIFGAEIRVLNQKIVEINRIKDAPSKYIIPGIIDAHVHIESSMLVPQEFANMAVKHGTVATVSDPHEIANVMGLEGVKFMINDSKKVPFKFYFGAPSCVPATGFETSGFTISADDIYALLKNKDIYYLSEMMNFPGVIYNDEEVLKKIQYAHQASKPIDGHAPGLVGVNLEKYASAGISTDHESVSLTEAIEKIKLGIKLQIREGSAAKNFDTLYPLIDLYPDDVMLCTDDCHPDDLEEKHIIDLLRRGVEKGVDLMNLIRAVTYNPVKHYNLDVGLLQLNDKADFVVVDNLKDFNVEKTYINGEVVYSGNRSLINLLPVNVLNNFIREIIQAADILVKSEDKDIRVIVAADGDLYTRVHIAKPLVNGGLLVSDVNNDILKIVLVNRYNQSKPVVGFVKNIGLKKGALAQSVAHDSHNIIAAGVSDDDILAAINLVIANKGGIVAVHKEERHVLPLPVAGLMSDMDGRDVSRLYKELNKKAKDWGSKLNSPFMTLSFMALLVIPELKIGDKGLFDGLDFKLCSLFVD